MPAAISRNIKHRPNRRKNLVSNQPQPASPILITDMHLSGSVVTLTFDQAVLLNGTPAFTTDLSGALPTHASQPAPNAVALTYASPVTGVTEINIGFRDPAIRNASGGYVTSTTFAG